MTRFEGENIGSGVCVWIFKSDDLTIPEPINGVISGDITISPSASPSVYYPSPETLHYRATEVEFDGNEGYETLLTLFLPKDRVELRRELMRWSREDVVCVYLSSNNEYLVIGSFEAPAVFRFISSDHKSSYASRNESSILIRNTSLNPCPFYEGDVSIFSPF